MTQPLITRLALPLLWAMAAHSASAHGDVQCPAAPKAEWRAPTALTAKLQAEGWAVRRVVATNSCYEVYAKDPQGQRIEAFFDPRTLERVLPQ